MDAYDQFQPAQPLPWAQPGGYPSDPTQAPYNSPYGPGGWRPMQANSVPQALGNIGTQIGQRWGYHGGMGGPGGGAGWQPPTVQRMGSLPHFNALPNQPQQPLPGGGLGGGAGDRPPPQQMGSIGGTGGGY